MSLGGAHNFANIVWNHRSYSARAERDVVRFLRLKWAAGQYTHISLAPSADDRLQGRRRNVEP